MVDDWKIYVIYKKNEFILWKKRFFFFVDVETDPSLNSTQMGELVA
jgi:hypothetical protein